MEPEAHTLNEDLSPRLRRGLSRQPGMGWLSVGVALFLIIALGLGVWLGTTNAVSPDATARIASAQALPAPPTPPVKRESEERTQGIAQPNVPPVMEETKSISPAGIALAVSAEIGAPPAPPPVVAERVQPPAAAVPAPAPIATVPPRRESPVETLPKAEIDRLVGRAQSMVETGDIAGARLLLTRALKAGDARAAFALAETYDPVVLARWRVRGIKPDAALARRYYEQALAGGLGDAQARIAALN